MILFHTFRRFRKPTLILKAILSKYTVIVRSKLKSRLEEKKNAHFRGECFDHLWEALKIIAKIHFIDLKSSLRGGIMDLQNKCWIYNGLLDSSLKWVLVKWRFIKMQLQLKSWDENFPTADSCCYVLQLPFHDYCNDYERIVNCNTKKKFLLVCDLEEE